MKITDVRRRPELPEAYLRCERRPKRNHRSQAVARPHNLAALHAVLAFEIIAHQLRPLGEREIHIRRQYVPHPVTLFTSVMHATIAA